MVWAQTAGVVPYRAVFGRYTSFGRLRFWAERLKWLVDVRLLKCFMGRAQGTVRVAAHRDAIGTNGGTRVHWCAGDRDYYLKGERRILVSKDTVAVTV